MSATFSVSNEIVDILRGGRISDKTFFINQNLSRPLYEQVNKVLSAMGAKWDRKAQGHIFEYDIAAELDKVLKTNQVTDWKKETDFFFTPHEIVMQMLGLIPYPCNQTITILEPSAGQGHILDAAKENFPNAVFKTIEINPFHCEKLTQKDYDVINSDFMEVEPFEVDVVLMNPPFTYEKEHIRHAYKFLKEDGILVSITSAGLWFKTDKKTVAFRTWLDSVNGCEVAKLPSGAFKLSGTGVTTSIIHIQKQEKC